MFANVAERFLLGRKRTVKLEILDLTEDPLEVGTRGKAQRDQIIATDQARRPTFTGPGRPSA